MTPLILFVLTALLLVTAAVLTRRRTLAWALGIGSVTLLIVLGAAALQLSLKFPGRDYLAYLQRTPPLRSFSDLATQGLPALLGLSLPALIAGRLISRQPLPNAVATWVANILAALAAVFVLLWLLFEPLQTVWPDLRRTLKLVPVLSGLLQSPWVIWIMLAALIVRGFAGHPNADAGLRRTGVFWPALAILGVTWVAAGAMRP